MSQFCHVLVNYLSSCLCLQQFFLLTPYGVPFLSLFLIIYGVLFLSLFLTTYDVPFLHFLLKMMFQLLLHILLHILQHMEFYIFSYLIGFLSFLSCIPRRSQQNEPKSKPLHRLLSICMRWLGGEQLHWWLGGACIALYEGWEKEQTKIERDLGKHGRPVELFWCTFCCYFCYL